METPTIQQLNDAFDACPKKTEDRICLDPEIKVKRETDKLYISEIRKNRIGLYAMVEVYHPQHGSDMATMPIGLLNDSTLRIIHQRLSE